MIVKALLEHDQLSGLASSVPEQIFHITDSHGLAFSISNDSLTSLRQSGVSFTTDPKINGVGGRNHYHFKMILDGNRIARDFELHTVKSFYRTSDGGRHQWNEQEVRTKEKSVTPLHEYLTGIVFLISPFSESFVQWLFYRNPGSEPFLDYKTSEAPRLIVALDTLDQWGVPMLMLQSGGKTRSLNAKEQTLIDFSRDIALRGYDFDQALEAIADEFPELVDHWNKPLTGDTVRRRKSATFIVKTLNSLANIPLQEMDPKDTRRKILSAMASLDIGDNLSSMLTSMMDEENLFHPYIAPVKWTSFFSSLIEMDVDSAVWYLKNMGKDLRRDLEGADPNDLFKWRGVHSKTGMAWAKTRRR